MISDETNNLIKDRAPAAYVADRNIFSADPQLLLPPHFVDSDALQAMQSAAEPIPRVAFEAAYEEYLRARENALIDEIRQLCGVSSVSALEAEQASAEAADQEMEAELAAGAARPSSSVKAIQFEFWSDFRRYCEERGSSLRFRKPGYQHWYNFSTRRSGFVIALTINTRENELACKLYMHADDARQAFAELQAQRDAIEAAIGEVTWDEVPDRQRCQIVQRRDGDVTRREAWPDYFAWFKDRAEAFQRELGPRVRSLGIEVEEEDVA